MASYTVQIIDERLGVFHDVVTTAATQYTHTGLIADTVYEYRVTANPVAGSGYTASAPSGVLYTRTLPTPDSVPPTTPGPAYATTIGTVSATISLANGSTDNHRVAGYVVQTQIGGVWTDIGTNDIGTIYLKGLTPATTYTIVVLAFDANGNRSAPSSPVTFTTRRTEPAPTCRVQISTWVYQYSAAVTIENMTAATVLDHWSLTFTLPAAHTVIYANAMTIARNGDQATGTPASWNTQINPGISITVGLMATWPAGTPLPSGFVLSGSAGTIPCPIG